MRNPAPNFIAGGTLVVVAVACFAFLDGPTAVFAGIAAAVGGAVLLIMGTQGGAPEPELYDDPLTAPGYQPPSDWDLDGPRRNT